MKWKASQKPEFRPKKEKCTRFHNRVEKISIENGIKFCERRHSHFKDDEQEKVQKIKILEVFTRFVPRLLMRMEA